MRPSKQRSRSKQNRPRTLGNVVNRVFDSSGPEGKVRGTPQQIIDKYLVLARDAQLSNDRVAAENFLQHAEHYARMLQEAQRETAREQEGRQQESRSQSGQQGGQQTGPQGGQQGGQQGQAHGNTPDRRQGERGQGERGHSSGSARDETGPTAVIDFDDSARDSGLVETPETATTDPARETEQPPQGPRTDATAPEAAPATEGKPAGRRRRGAPRSETAGDETAQPGTRAPRARRPRKPAADSSGSSPADASVAE